MKIAALIARYLLGLIFTVFGLNGFLHFIPQPPMPSGTAGQFFDAMMVSHYVYFVSGVQVVCGLLFLANRFVPLALVTIAAVIANILVFHITMAPSGIAPGVIAAVLWILLAYDHRAAFTTLLQARASSSKI